MRIVFHNDGSISYEPDTSVKESGKSHKSHVDRPDKGKSIIAALDEYVAIDLETTGLSPADNEIIEFAAVHVKNGLTEDTFSCLANPKRPIPHEITLKTGITDEMVAAAPPVSKVLYDFLHFVCDLPLVGYNVSFDVNFLYDSAMRHYGHGIDNTHIDVCRIARNAIPGQPNYKLGTVLSYFGISNDHAHRALSDALATQQLYERLKGFIPYDGTVLPESSFFGGYTNEHVYQAVQRAVGYDEDNVNLRVNKSGASIYMFGGVAFSIRINTRTQCLDTQNSAAFDYIDRIPGASVSGGVCHIPIACSASAGEAIADLIRDVYAARKASVVGDSFGCCNDFIRCSDNLECLHKDNLDYVGCLYRRNLEAGKVFYGKNKNC